MVDKAEANCTELIRQLHIDISNLQTPKEYVEVRQHDGIQFPNPEYMRAIQMKYFPNISWSIEDRPIFNANKLVAWAVMGKLEWDYAKIGFPDIRRSGMMPAAHRVQYKKGTDTLADLGNDVKAANTDTWKKALNFYLNICDDIYRWETPELSPMQINTLLKKADGLRNEERKEQITKTVEGDSLLLNKKNFNKWLSKIDYEIEQGK